MLLLDNTYFKPTTKLRTLALLEAMALDGSMSQQDMCGRAAMSVAMVNQYIRNMGAEELIRLEPLNGKSYRYLLTEDGEKMRRESFGNYCAEIVQSYTALKNMVQDKLSSLLERSLHELVFYGASETCEVVLSTLEGTPFKVVGLIDSDPEKQGRMFHGYPISAPEALSEMDCRAVVITSFGRQEEIYRQLSEIAGPKKLEVVRL